MPERNAAKTSTFGRLKAIEKTLALLDNVDLSSTNRYSDYDIETSNFPRWVKFAKAQKDPDRIRNCLYYGFQPLFDSLTSGRIRFDAREDAVLALNGIISTSNAYLTSYYLGRPDRSVLVSGLEGVESALAKLDLQVYYRKKSRNIDRNMIYPANVLSFIKQFLAHAIDSKIKLPDYVVGCACGSSEIALPLAGMLGVDVGFMRKSKRRHDSNVHMVEEQEPEIGSAVKGSNVVCVEDYVVTSQSLADVMVAVQRYAPSSLIGASIRFSEEVGDLNNFVRNDDFYLFRR